MTDIGCSGLQPSFDRNGDGILIFFSQLSFFSTKSTAYSPVVAHKFIS